MTCWLYQRVLSCLILHLEQKYFQLYTMNNDKFRCLFYLDIFCCIIGDKISSDEYLGQYVMITNRWIPALETMSVCQQWYLCAILSQIRTFRKVVSIRSNRLALSGSCERISPPRNIPSKYIHFLWTSIHAWNIHVQWFKMILLFAKWQDKSKTVETI